MKKLILKSDLKALESCLNKLESIQSKISGRHNLAWGWEAEIPDDASADLRHFAQSFDSAHFFLGELWIQSSEMNKKGTSKEDCEHLDQFKESNNSEK